MTPTRHATPTQRAARTVVQAFHDETIGAFASVRFLGIRIPRWSEDRINRVADTVLALFEAIADAHDHTCPVCGRCEPITRRWAS